MKTRVNSMGRVTYGELESYVAQDERCAAGPRRRAECLCP